MKKITKVSFLEIKNNTKRFLSLLLIVLLGVGFFAGVKATSPDMKKAIDTYFDEKNVMDIQIASTLGVTKNDIQQLENIQDVQEVVGAYSKDTILLVDEKEVVVKVHSLLENINQVQVMEGRLPENQEECVVEESFLDKLEKQIGDTIQVENDKDGFFKQEEFTIVGSVRSPMYISNERGTTKLSSGKINYYMYVLDSAIESEVYTECYILVKQAKPMLCLDTEYIDKIKSVKTEIERISEQQKEERYQDVLKEANKEVNDAENTLKEKKQEVEEQIKEGKDKIAQVKKEIEENQEELKNQENTANNQFQKAEKQLEQASKELQQNKEVFETEKTKALQELEQAEQQQKALEENKKELEIGLQNLQQNIEKLIINQQKLDEHIMEMKAQLETVIQPEQKEQIKIAIQEAEQQKKEIQNNYDLLEEQQKQGEQSLKQVNAGIQQIKQSIQQGKKEIEQNEKKLQEAEKQIKTQKNTLNQTKNTTNKQIANAKQQLKGAKIAIEEQENKVKEEEQKAQQELASAQEEINDAKDKVKDIKRPEWYLLDRQSNYGYAQYSQDTDRIANIGKVFPAVFFIVAALISLTSMTRMVEEQRVQIGTLKALGYKKGQIIQKYLVYATLATFSGGIIGMVIGFYTLPKLIFSMYNTMYALPEIVQEFNWEYAITGLLFASICTIGATLYSSIRELKETPAQLMRPKAPKVGKKVLLERIQWLWGKLKFTQKVTARNIFRYKKRFLMTIIGILGSTALILAGFGLRDSIVQMIPAQYEDIFRYQLTTTFKEETSREQIKEQTNKIIEIEGIQDSISVHMQTVDILEKDNTQDIQLIIPSDINKLNDFIMLKNKKTGEPYLLKENGIILTEKLANLLAIKVGDVITIKNADEQQAKVKVSQITENYIMHYMYMSPELYSDLFQDNVKYNVLLSKTETLTEKEEQEIGKQILELENISGVNFSNVTKGTFDEVMKNLGLVVGILIVSAGLLAFVVLYNLANVNISERIREIATIKVLGFYDKEVYRYLNRETVILTGIGIAFGLVAGYILNTFILKTCELDMFMFKQNIQLTSYLWAIGITIAFTWIVNIVTYFYLKKVDMIESLKSVE